MIYISHIMIVTMKIKMEILDQTMQMYKSLHIPCIMTLTEQKVMYFCNFVAGWEWSTCGLEAQVTHTTKSRQNNLKNKKSIQSRMHSSLTLKKLLTWLESQQVSYHFVSRYCSFLVIFILF